MTYFETILDGEDLDFAGKYEPKHDKIKINFSRIRSAQELVEVIEHEILHATFAWAADPVETTPDQDHEMIRSLSFE